MKINVTRNATRANANPVRPVYMESSPALPAAVNEATQTGGVIWAIMPK